MKYQNQRREQQEDEALARLMDQVFQAEGAWAMEWHQRLRQDPACQRTWRRGAWTPSAGALHANSGLPGDGSSNGPRLLRSSCSRRRLFSAIHNTGGVTMHPTTRNPEKKELLLFLAVTYGLPLLMTLPMAVLFQAGRDVSLFPAAQMFYPAAGLILANLICRKGDPLLPRRFFLAFLALTGVMVFWCLAGFLLPGKAAVNGGSYSSLIGTVLLIVLYLSEGKEKRAAYQLTGKNWGRSALLLLLFVALTYGSALLFALFSEGLSGAAAIISAIEPKKLPFLVFLPLVALLSLAPFFGEEYGWRTYFQPLLQQKFGGIKGVLLFGLLWESWHLPLVVFYYAPALPAASLPQLLVLRYGVTILLAIFMAYAYGKTQNVWLPVLVHFINNFLATGEGTVVFSWGMIGGLLLIKGACYLPFLFSKVFRAQETASPEEAPPESP